MISINEIKENKKSGIYGNTGGTKLERFLPKNQHAKKEITEFWELD